MVFKDLDQNEMISVNHLLRPIHHRCVRPDLRRHSHHHLPSIPRHPYRQNINLSSIKYHIQILNVF